MDIGWGSSYLLELYADYGVIGIIIYSIAIGIFLCSLRKILNMQNIWSVIVLYSLTYIYMTPRAEALRIYKFYNRNAFLDTYNISLYFNMVN